MSIHNLDDPVVLPPINLRQLNTITAALKLAGVRYGMLLQLMDQRGSDIPPLSHDELGDLQDVCASILKEMTP